MGGEPAPLGVRKRGMQGKKGEKLRGAPAAPKEKLAADAELKNRVTR